MRATNSSENHGLRKIKVHTELATDLQNVDIFQTLPYEMLAEIFGKLEPKQRQQLRSVCGLWRSVIDDFHGIHVVLNNMNWNGLEKSSCIKSVTTSGFSRDVLHAKVFASRLVKLEITDFIAYYSLMPILEECQLLEYLFFSNVSFLPKSRLPEYNSTNYLQRDGKGLWLPRLKHLKFVSVTTQSSVYNHLVPTDFPEELNGLDNAVRSFDVSRGEMEFIPLLMQILMNSRTLAHIDMVLTDIWKINFADFLHVDVEEPLFTSDISLWHFGSKRLLPIGPLLKNVNTLTSMNFSFPHHLDAFYMKFRPLSTRQIKQPFQLEEVIVRQSMRWSQEMRDIDNQWLEILENQHTLKRLEYPFPVLSGGDQRMTKVIHQNCKSLENISFIGHRDQEPDWIGVRQRGRLPWDAEWFSNCERLEELHLKCHTRFLGPTGITYLIKPCLLPHSLKHFEFHGCIDTGNSPLCALLHNLRNLETFVHQSRLCPWYSVNGQCIVELQTSHVQNILMSLPLLKTWKLEWCDSSSAIVAHFTLNNTHVQVQSACVADDVLEWMRNMTTGLEFREITLDRQMKGLIISRTSPNDK